MKIKLLVPIIYQNQLCRQGTVIEVNPLDGARWVHEKIAVPVTSTPFRQIITPQESRENDNGPV
ncbi:hypothetical protein [Endozoicomonas sp. 4G]|uniref:hypothetical protein n=1 Tax=Endozoicomonas sp. 4G TaxID=2872754 RepID=UPI002078CCF4|nr:hypothetical protein [Endozoicomonas sp. 4G]